MNEETPALTQPLPTASAGAAPESNAAAEPPAKREKSHGAAWAGIAAVLALAVAGGAGWQAWETRQRVAEMREELAGRLAANDAVVAEVRTLARQQQEALAGVQGKLGALESKVQATEGQAAALESLYQEFSRSREDRVVAEVEQAVSIAAQQLQLAGNVEAALVALQGAEARLAAVDRGQLASLRRAIGRDIEQLRAQPQVDVPGIALRLETLLERVDSLPLSFTGEAESPRAEETPPAEVAAPSVEASAIDFVRELARDLWRELKSLVRIERLDQAEPVLLAPEQSAYLRENLRIRLLTARLALLARDGRTFDVDLAQARGWLERYFDQRNERVAATISELKSLEATEMAAEPPSLVESFAALRMLQARAGEIRSAGPDQPTATESGSGSLPASSGEDRPQGGDAAQPGR